MREWITAPPIVASRHREHAGCRIYVAGDYPTRSIYSAHGSPIRIEATIDGGDKIDVDDAADRIAEAFAAIIAEATAPTAQKGE